MTFMWAIIYLVAGFGAYWIVCQEGLHIRDMIEKKFGDKADDVYADYYRRTQFIPQIHSVFMYILLAAVLIVGIWILWPIIAIGGGIYEWFVYRHVDKIWSKKLELE